jgi:hypothetical protein
MALGSLHVEQYSGGGHHVALTSFSVTPDELAPVAQRRGLDVVDPWALLGPIGGYCVPSTDTVHFNDGFATLPCFTTTDTETMGLSFLNRHCGTWMQTKVTAIESPLPLSSTMRRPHYFGERRYLDGPLVSGGKVSGTFTIQQPLGTGLLLSFGNR